MTTQTTTTQKTRIDVGQEAGKFAVTGIGITAALIGLWATACLMVAFLSNGVGTMVRGYITTLTGM